MVTGTVAAIYFVFGSHLNDAIITLLKCGMIVEVAQEIIQKCYYYFRLMSKAVYVSLCIPDTRERIVSCLY